MNIDFELASNLIGTRLTKLRKCKNTDSSFTPDEIRLSNNEVRNMFNFMKSGLHCDQALEQHMEQCERLLDANPDNGQLHQEFYLLVSKMFIFQLLDFKESFCHLFESCTIQNAKPE